MATDRREVSFSSTIFADAVKSCLTRRKTAKGLRGKILPYSPTDSTIGVVMKLFGFVLVMCVLFVSCASAPDGIAGTSGRSGGNHATARKESSIPWRSMDSYDQHGKKTGSYKKSGTTINQYDRHGKKTGSLRETSSGYVAYDKDGTKTGSYKTRGNTTTQYDQHGLKIGTYKTGSNGVITSYDQHGRKTGSFKKDSSGRITEYDKHGSKVGSYRQR